MEKMMKRHVLAARLFAAAALPALAAFGTVLPAATSVAQAQQMTTLPNVADLADKLLPAVVEISVESKVSGGSTVEMPQLPDDSPFKDFFDDFFKKRQGQDNGERTVNSMGSGFIVDASGVVVTNNHVVEGAQSIQIRMQDGTTLKAELKGRDPKTDLAVLVVKPDKPLPTVTFGDSDQLRIGEWVMAIGNPFGLGGSVSLGIVSARNRDINAGPYDDFIQTDAAINKGNSGGPLFNMTGQVVGINTAIFSPSGGSVGIGFSVPANTARSVVDQLAKYGETRRGWFGVKVQSVTDELAESMGLGKPRGALVADVVDGSPGKAAGVEAGDVIVEFDGKSIREMKELTRTVAETEIGKQVTVKVLRKGKEVELKVAIGRLEDVEKAEAQKNGSGDSGTPTPPPAAATLLGMTVSTITDDLRSKFSIDEKVSGAVVTEVANEGAAADKQIMPGDVIMEAGGKPVTSSADVSDAAAAAQKAGKSSVLLLISKGGKAGETRFIALKVK
jgi:serine protease Do